MTFTSGEAERLAALEELGILDTAPETHYDDLVKLASEICETPMAIVTLIGRDRQWFKAKVGLDVEETAREFAFCAHTIQQATPLVVPDTTKDPRFRENPFVTGETHVRFYAGVPLTDEAGYALGALCVVDRTPRELTPLQRRALEVLGHQVMILLQGRRRLLQLEQARAEARFQNDRFLAFINNSPAAAYMKDSRGRYLFVNRAVGERFKTPPDAWVGLTDEDLFPANDDVIRAHDLAVLAGTGVVTIDEEITGPNGEVSYWQSHKFPLVNLANERLLGGMSLDVTEAKVTELALAAKQVELEAANAKLQILSLTDALTGLQNWASFKQGISHEVLRAVRYGNPLSLVMLDIDHFKLFNDTFGHPAGDEVIAAVGTLLRRSAREVDIVARCGGEEFAAVLPDTDAPGAALMADRVRRTIEAAPWPKRAITVSVGVATRTPSMRDPSALIEAADGALYASKHAGRNRVTVAEQKTGRQDP